MPKNGEEIRRPTRASSPRASKSSIGRGAEPPAPRRPFRWIYYLTVVGVWLVIGVAGVLAYFAADLPSTKGLEQQDGAASVTLLDARGRLIARRGILRGEFVSVSDLPPHVWQAVLASEDRRFYDHFGFDLWGMGRALWANIQAGRVVQGGSTISQQLAKNLFLKPERTIERKVQEALLALYLELSFSKNEILSLYLNRVYFGAGAVGIDAASKRYFNKSATKLSLIEGAILAGLLKAPSRYSPINGEDLSHTRARIVLRSMVESSYLTPEQMAQARNTRPKFVSGLSEQGSLYFTDWVMEELPELAGRPQSDVIVETTLDLDLQRHAEAAMARGLIQSGQKNLQGALVAMSPTGEVRAMVGGRSYSTSVYNRATQAKRQPGSAFKPFVYLAALENGYRPETLVEDAPVSYRGWSPANFSGQFDGPMTLTDSLARSVNTVAVQLCLRLGPESVVDAARRLGITSDLDPVPSLALGTSEVTLLELVNAYAPFAHDGRGALAHGVRRVKTSNGEVLYSRSGSGLGQIVSAHTVSLMNEMLMQAVETGTGKSARIDQRAVAGKTGTSQDFKDAWFVGYGKQLVAGVWVGNDNGAPMGRDVRGSTLPAQMWKSFMREGLAGKPKLPLVTVRTPQDSSSSGDVLSAFDELLAGLDGADEQQKN